MKKSLIALSTALALGMFTLTSCEEKPKSAEESLADAKQEAREDKAEINEDLQEAKMMRLRSGRK